MSTKFKKTNKLPMEDILVVRGDVAFPTGAFVNSTTSLNLTNGGLGVLSWDMGSTTRPLGNFITAADNSNTVQAIKVVNGTPASANITLADSWEAGDKAYLQSGIIRKDSIRSVVSKAARHAKLAGDVAEAFGTPANNTEYKAYLRLKSVRNDRTYGDNDEVVHSIVAAKDFTAAGTTSSKDWVLEYLAANFNTQSRLVKGNKNFVVLGVRSVPTTPTAPSVPTIGLTSGVVTSVTGGTGGSNYTTPPTIVLTGGSPTTAAVITATINSAGAITGYTIVSGGAGYSVAPTASFSGGTGTVIGTLTPNTVVPFFKYNGTTYSMTMDIPALKALADAVAQSTPLVGTSTIEVIDTTLAGGMLKVDTLIVLGIPHTKAAAYDDVEQVIVDPELNLGPTFTALAPTRYKIRGDEGAGQGWKWTIQWRHRAGLNVHTKQIQPLGDYFIEGLSYITDSKYYTSLEIEYLDREDTLTSAIQSPKRLVLLYPAEVSSSFTINVNNIVTRLVAGNTPIPFVSSNDAGTGTASSNAVPNTNTILAAWLEHARTNGNAFTLGGDSTSSTYLS